MNLALSFTGVLVGGTVGREAMGGSVTIVYIASQLVPRGCVLGCHMLLQKASFTQWTMCDLSEFAKYKAILGIAGSLAVASMLFLLCLSKQVF